MRMSLFGYRIIIERDPTKKITSGMRFSYGGCRLKAIQPGYIILTDPDGIELPKQTDMIIKSPLNEPITATVTFLIGGIE